MKRNNIIRLALVLVSVGLFASCETDMEKAQKEYSADQVVPAVISATGSTLVTQTFSYTYKVTYERAGSTWAWAATDATVSSVSADTKSAVVLFGTLPTDGTANVQVTETTAGGVTSDPKIWEVTVKAFCPLALSGFVGTWTGTDGAAPYSYASTCTATVSGTQLLISGLNVGFMEDFWAETITAGGTCLATINPDGTLTIAEQYFCDTDYSDGYKIKGTSAGIWDNCGAHPTMTIYYDIWYPDSNYWIAARYGAANFTGGKTYLTATLTLN